jgi:hypothetical protein
MLNLLLPIAVGAVAGAGAGGLAAWWQLRRHRAKPQMAESVPLDPRLEEEIEGTATAWATSNGRPEAAGIVADKLRLLHHLSQRRGRRPR